MEINNKCRIKEETFSFTTMRISPINVISEEVNPIILVYAPLWDDVFPDSWHGVNTNCWKFLMLISSS